MNTFRADEIVLIAGRAYPVVGGRLRLAHEGNENITIKTDLIHFVVGQEAVLRAEVTTSKGSFCATGVATSQRDPMIADALVELAETRAIARALRWAGYGFEVGVEEVGEAVLGNRDDERAVDGGDHRRPVDIGASHVRPSRVGSPASSAQRRVIQALARRLGEEADRAVAAVVPGVDLDHLTLRDASTVIDRLKSRLNGDGAGPCR